MNSLEMHDINSFKLEQFLAVIVNLICRQVLRLPAGVDGLHPGRRHHDPAGEDHGLSVHRDLLFRLRYIDFYLWFYLPISKRTRHFFTVILDLHRHSHTKRSSS